MWPAAYGGVLAVTGCDEDDRQDAEAAFGMWTDIAAPSVGVPVFHPDGFVAFLGGTSHAAPLVTGADLIASGYAPGPRMGEMLRWIQDEQLEGRVTTRDEAVRRVRERFPPADGEQPLA